MRPRILGNGLDLRRTQCTPDKLPFSTYKNRRSSVPPAEIAILRDESPNAMGFGLGVLATLIVLYSSLRQARNGNKLAGAPRHYVRT